MIMTGILLVIGVAIGIVVLQVLITVLGAFLDNQPIDHKENKKIANNIAEDPIFTLEAWLPFIIFVIIGLIVVALTQ